MSDVDNLEAQRVQLEDAVAKLRKALQHWRTWDAEYEGLKEELEKSDEVQNEADCIRINQELGGELVDEKEICELFGIGKTQVRSNHEVANLVDRRQDYVLKNIDTISAQVRKIEEQIDQVIEQQNQDDDYGASALPLTEIIEELDEDGNIIASKTLQPESAQSQILETLRKAGLTDIGGQGSPQPSDEQTTKESPQGQVAKKVPSPDDEHTVSTKNVQKKVPSSKPADQSKSAKKSVKFAEEDEVREFATPAEAPFSTSSKQNIAVPSPSLVSGSFSSNDRVLELDDDDEIIGATPIIPEDESPEDAQLRREMLQYSLNEVGSVVAELDLDEEYSDDSNDEDFELEEEADNSEVSEDEDEHGRSRRKGVTESYRQQILDLEERLMARMIENVGPEPDETSPFIDPKELRKVVVRRDDQMPSAQGQANPVKKGVRFAEKLDISEAPTPPISKSTKRENVVPKPAPISESVLERRPVTAPVAKSQSTPAKMSRFKQAKAAQATTPSEQADRPILSESVFERPAAPTNTTAPAPADELDPEVQQRQLASEYYRMRNNMIRQQGGFKVTDEDRDQPLMEEVDGKVKKVSRFKAARLR